MDRKRITEVLESANFGKNEIKLNVSEDSIEVRAQRKHESEEDDEGFYVAERSYQGFYRKARLPEK